MARAPAARRQQPAADVTDGRVRAVIDAVRPAVDDGRFAVKRVAGDPVEVEANCFADGHDVLRVMLRWRAEGEPRFQEVEMAPLGNDVWRGVFTVPALGRYRYTVCAWVDHFQSWRHELERRVDADDIRLAARAGAELLDAAAARAKGADRKALSGWAKRLRQGAADAALPAEALKATALDAALASHRRRATPIAASRPPIATELPRRRRPRARALLRLVRAVPALDGGRGGPPRHLPRRRGAPAVRRRDGLRRPLPAADPPDRHATFRKGPNNTLDRRARRRRQPVGDRRGRGRPQGDPSASSARSRTSAACVAQAARARHRGRARHRLPVRARPPVGAGAPGVVPHAARRHDPVRREPAQEIPGHLSVRLRDRRLARAVGGAARACSCSGSTQGVTHLPRRQPAHQAVPVLGVGDRARSSASIPDVHLPRRGVHPAEGDVPARQARLHAVVHLLHLAQHASGS